MGDEERRLGDGERRRRLGDGDRFRGGEESESTKITEFDRDRFRGMLFPNGELKIKMASSLSSCRNLRSAEALFLFFRELFHERGDNRGDIRSDFRRQVIPSRVDHVVDLLVGFVRVEDTIMQPHG